MFINLKDFQLFYEVHGKGKPLILISGFASGAWIWYRQIDDLSKNFSVITFDPRGVAQSPVPDGVGVSIEEIADDVAQLIDVLNLGKADILGASFGGFVAQEFALKYPEKLNKLILACTSFGGNQHIAPSPEVLMSFAPTDEMNSTERVRKFMLPAFTKEYAAENSDEIEKVCALREANVVPEAVYLQQLVAATTFDTKNRVSAIKAETLVLTGDKDMVVPMENTKNLAKLIPNSRLQVIEGGSHMFFIENADVFNREVKEFLQRAG